MATEQDQRPRYYEDQYLGADDLNGAVNFGRVQHARHLLGGHTWGISIGLELVQRPQPSGREDVYLTPGYAWDAYGRPIVALAPVKISESLFSKFRYDSSNPDHRDGKGQLIKVWVQYDERSFRTPTRGFESCNEGDHHARIQETFRIVVGERGKSEQRGSVIIDGVPVDPVQVLGRFDQPAATPRTLHDESVPHQELPTADSENPLPIWLVPVGYVRWLPEENGPGRFLERDDASNSPKRPDTDMIREFRRYAGVVTEAIEAAGGVIRLRDRLKDPTTSHFTPPRVKPDNGSAPENDLVWVEGDLRIEGDTRLAGGKLAFRKSNGDDNDVPLEIRRTDSSSGAGALQIIIGPEGSSQINRLVVGCVDPSQPSQPIQLNNQKLVVTSEGKVGVGTSDPNGKLDVANLVRVGLDEGGSGAKVITFARDAVDEVNAGKIAYKPTWDNGALAIVGAGNPPHRRIRMWEDLIVQGSVGIGAANPMGKLTVEAAEHINVLLDRTDTQDHMTLTVGSAGTGIHFGNSNRFFISADPYNDRNIAGFGNEVVSILPNGKVGIGTQPRRSLDVNGEIVAVNRLTLAQDTSETTRTWHVDHHDTRFRIFQQDNINTPGIERLTIDIDGRIGIGTGTGSPLSDRLEVRGNIKLGAAGDLFALGALENLRVVIGHVGSNGTKISGDGFTSRPLGQGKYQVTLNPTFPASPVITVSPINSSDEDNLLTVLNHSGGGFDIVARDVAPRGGGENVEQNTEFTFIVIGRRT